jgi:hypothetical protein
VSSASVGGAAFSLENVELAAEALTLRIPAAAVIFSVVRKIEEHRLGANFFLIKTEE